MKKEGAERKNGLGVLTGVSLLVCGLFTVEGGLAYADGNLTYLELPLAMLLSLVAALPAAFVLKRSGEETLPALFRSAFGGFGGRAFALPLAAALVFCAAAPLSQLVNALHGLVYSEVPPARIFIFVIPTTAFMAWRGAKGLGRTAIVVSALLAVSAAAALIYSAPGFETYRLTPLPGIQSVFAFTGSHTLYALAPFAALLSSGGGEGKQPQKAAFAGLFAALISGLMQLALALVYPARVLEGLSLPLARITFLSVSKSYVLRLDKLLIMLWTAGCMLSAAFLIRAAAGLTAPSERAQKPLSLVFCALAGALILAEVGGSMGEITRFVARFGWAFALAPLAVLSLAALIKTRRRI
jgi:hypothetical protein